VELHVATNIKRKFLFTDLIKNYENIFTDEALLSQLGEEPLGMDDDVSFDFLNLPNTLEYIAQSHPPQAQAHQQPHLQQPQLQQNHQHSLPKQFLTGSTTLPQVTQKSPVLIPSQKLISSLSSPTVSASTSPPLLTSPRNTLESSVIHSTQQRVTAPVCTVTQSPTAILLHSSGVGQSTQQQNQNSSLTFSNIQTSVPGQQQINLQPVSAAALQNSHIQLQLQALKQHQKTVKHSSAQNQLLTLQGMRQLPTDNVQQVRTLFFPIMQTAI
jgi:hypothetical protein